MCIYTVPYGTSQEEVNRDKSRANRRAKIGNKLKEGKKRKERKKVEMEGRQKNDRRKNEGRDRTNALQPGARERESEMEDSD